MTTMFEMAETIDCLTRERDEAVEQVRVMADLCVQLQARNESNMETAQALVDLMSMLLNQSRKERDLVLETVPA